jgi:hypothetical protein
MYYKRVLRLIPRNHEDMVLDDVRTRYGMVVDGEILDGKRVKYLTKDSLLAKETACLRRNPRQGVRRPLRTRRSSTPATPVRELPGKDNAFARRCASEVLRAEFHHLCDTFKGSCNLQLSIEFDNGWSKYPMTNALQGRSSEHLLGQGPRCGR